MELVACLAAIEADENAYRYHDGELFNFSRWHFTLICFWWSPECLNFSKVFACGCSVPPALTWSPGSRQGNDISQSKTLRRVDHVRLDLGEDTLPATGQHTSR